MPSPIAQRSMSCTHCRLSSNREVSTSDMPSSFYSESSSRVAPCIVDRGIVCQKQDIQRLLSDLTWVSYTEFHNGEAVAQGEGCVKQVFIDDKGATLIANRSLYINLQSFDYMELSTVGHESNFDLVQDNRRLRIVPLANPMHHSGAPALDSATLEVMMAEVLSANLDAQLDDDTGSLF